MSAETEVFVLLHGQYLKDYPGQACLLDISRTLNAVAFSNGALRSAVLNEMGPQIARDAFTRGLGIIGLSDPLYRVEHYLGLRDTPPKPSGYLNPEWTEDEPPAHLLDRNATVEILIKAIGFPIRVREL